MRTEHNPNLLIPNDRVAVFKANLQSYKGKLSSWQAYQAKKGESYAAIAKRHGMTLTELRAANGIGSSKTKAAGQMLLVSNGTGSTGGIQLTSLEIPADEPPSSAPNARKKDVVVLRRKANVRTHTVKSGETLFSLAQRYNTSVDELRKLNNLKGNTLAKGKQLRVPGTNIRG